MRTLLDQFLNELSCLGLNEAQVRAHLVFMRLWQRHLHPQRLLGGPPEALPTFLERLAAAGAQRAEIQYAEDAVGHFYAFALDHQADFPTRHAWSAHLLGPLPQRSLPVWEAVLGRLEPVFRRLAPTWVHWTTGAQP